MLVQKANFEFKAFNACAIDESIFNEKIKNQVLLTLNEKLGNNILESDDIVIEKYCIKSDLKYTFIDDDEEIKVYIGENYVVINIQYPTLYISA